MVYVKKKRYNITILKLVIDDAVYYKYKVQWERINNKQWITCRNFIIIHMMGKAFYTSEESF